MIRAAFVINLDSRPDRYERFRKEFEEKFPELPCIRVPATDGRELTYTSGLNERINAWNFRHLREHMLRGVVGCCLSHLDVWRSIVDMPGDDDEWFMILEDDCTFIGDFDESFLTPDVDFVWLSKPTRPVPYTRPIQWTQWPHIVTAECYVLRRRVARHLIHHIQNDIGAVDEHMRQYFASIGHQGAYIYFPSVATQVDRVDSNIR